VGLSGHDVGFGQGRLGVVNGLEATGYRGR
jgi:hypothetical protein